MRKYLSLSESLVCQKDEKIKFSPINNKISASM